MDGLPAGEPGLLNAAQALALVSSEILVIAARIDAYERAEARDG